MTGLHNMINKRAFYHYPINAPQKSVLKILYVVKLLKAVSIK